MPAGDVETFHQDGAWHNRIEGEKGTTGPFSTTLVEPIVVEISADVAMTGHSFRHAVRFVRARPELPVDEVVAP